LEESAMDPFWKRIPPSFSTYASVNKVDFGSICKKYSSDQILIEIRSCVLVLGGDETSEIEAVLNLQENHCCCLPSELEDYYEVKLNVKPNLEQDLFLCFFSRALAEDFVQQCHRVRVPVQLFDFEPIATIGRGRWGKVIVCSLFCNNKTQLFAVKEMNASRPDNLKYIQEERLVLAQLSDHPFTIKICFATVKGNFAYLVMDFQPGGDLFNLLRQYKLENCDVVFYSAQMVLALEHVHTLNIIHRDIKPENILLDRHGNLKLADFGLAKILVDGKKTNTFCGSDPYLAPEMISRQHYSFSVDFWQLGCLIFELFCGHSPFFHRLASSAETRLRIQKCLVQYPFEVSDQARALLKQILVAKPLDRIACDTEHWPRIKRSNLYADVDWNALLDRKMKPPIQTAHPNTNVLDNFQEEFTAETCNFEFNTSTDDVNENLLGFDFSSSYPNPTDKMDATSSAPPFC